MSAAEMEQSAHLFQLQKEENGDLVQDSKSGDKTPDTFAEPTTSTIKSRSDRVNPTSPTSLESKQHGSCVILAQPGSPARKEIASASSSVDEVSSQEVALDQDLYQGHRLPSYRPSILPEESTQVVRKRLSDEKIGPRRPTSVKTSTPQVGTMPSANEDLCKSFFARIVGQEASLGKPAQAPLGKPIAATHLDDTPQGTPTAWHNMASKRRGPSTSAHRGTPSSNTSFKSSKRAISRARVSSVAVHIPSASPHGLNGEVPSTSTIGGVRHYETSHLALNVNKRIMRPDYPSPSGSSSQSCATALETVTGSKRQKPKKGRKSALVDDTDIQSDLQAVGTAILARASFALPTKRPARSLLVPEEKPSKKPRKSLQDDNINHKIQYNQSTSSITAAASRRTLVERNWVQQNAVNIHEVLQERIDEPETLKKNNDSGLQHTQEPSNALDILAGGKKLKIEAPEEEIALEESEEYEGQNLLRKIHKERRKAMLADPLKSKGRGAYAAQV